MIQKANSPFHFSFRHGIIRKKRGMTSPTKKRRYKHMDIYVCTVCGYVYDPAVGDPDNGLEPGVPFEDLPETFECPVCGVGKDMFEKQ